MVSRLAASRDAGSRRLEVGIGSLGGTGVLEELARTDVGHGEVPRLFASVISPGNPRLLARPSDTLAYSQRTVGAAHVQSPLPRCRWTRTIYGLHRQLIIREFLVRSDKGSSDLGRRPCRRPRGPRRQETRGDRTTAGSFPYSLRARPTSWHNLVFESSRGSALQHTEGGVLGPIMVATSSNQAVVAGLTSMLTASSLSRSSSWEISHP